MNEYMKIALDEGLSGIISGTGGPFGAVIERDGEVIARAHNRVLETQDPTMHAEIAAIRAACETLGRFSLHDCVIYSTCQPCPMCLGAIIWAKIPKLYYGCINSDAARIGFDDEFIYNALRGDLSDIDGFSAENIDRGECLKLFGKWTEMPDREMY